MSKKQRKLDTDRVITPIVIKKLLTPIKTTKHYKDGLVDSKGNLLRDPEEGEISDLDLLMYKLQGVMAGKEKLLAPKMSRFKNTSDDTWYSRVMPLGKVDRVIQYDLVRDAIEGFKA